MPVVRRAKQPVQQDDCPALSRFFKMKLHVKRPPFYQSPCLRSMLEIKPPSWKNCGHVFSASLDQGPTAADIACSFVFVCPVTGGGADRPHVAVRLRVVRATDQSA